MNLLPRNNKARSAMLLGDVLVAGLLVTVSPQRALAAPLNDCVSSDHGNPVLKSFSRSPAAVDVTARAQRISFTLHVEDLGGPGPASGVNTVRVGFGGAPDLDVPSEPIADLRPDGSGAWAGSFVVPRWSRPGRVPLGVVITDRADNYRFIEPADLAAAGFPNSVTVTSVADTTPPRLASLRFAPRRLDTRRSARVLTVTATARDHQSGVQDVLVNGLMGSQTFTRDPDGTIRLTKVAGTKHTFRGSTRVPRWVGTGTWQPYSVAVEDRIGNVATYGERRLARLGVAHGVSVTSRTDTAGPELRRFALNPAALDVRSRDGQVVVTVRAVDAQSGVRSVEAWFWDAEEGTQATLHRVAGTGRRGIWRGVYDVPHCTPQAGNLRARVTLSDNSGRTRVYRSATLAAAGWPHHLRVTAEDHRAPQAFVPDSPLTGPITVYFTEAVNGITSTSAVVHREIPHGVDDFTQGPAVAGTWACRSSTGAATSCETGRVITARFAPTDALTRSSYYAVTLNPEFSLSVTDLAGNPVIADDLSVETAP